MINIYRRKIVIIIIIRQKFIYFSFKIVCEDKQGGYFYLDLLMSKQGLIRFFKVMVWVWFNDRRKCLGYLVDWFFSYSIKDEGGCGGGGDRLVK